MLVCPVCHHEVPMASTEAPSDATLPQRSGVPLCHVTPKTPQPSTHCPLRMHRRVFPYTCGCLVSHRTSLPSNNLFFDHHQSSNNNLDVSHLQISNSFVSCPTSPLPNTSQVTNPFRHLNSKLMCGGSNCSIEPQHKPLNRVSSLGQTSFQCPEEMGGSNQFMCHNSTSCIDEKPEFRRQLSCPNGPCVTSCHSTCGPQLHQEHFATPTTTIITSSSSHPVDTVTTQIQLQYHDKSQSQSGDKNIVILNGNGSGGLIVENKANSRSNSPDLNISFSSFSKSGQSTPEEHKNNVIDRDQLMRTLASLPPISNFNVQLSQQNPLPSGNSQQISFSNSLQGQLFSLSTGPTRSPNVSQDSLESRGLDGATVDSASQINVRTSGGNVTVNLVNSTTPAAICQRLSQSADGANSWTSDDDERVLRNAKEELEDSGFYYGSLTWREANDVLSGAPEGSFLVRDSWSGRCLYALSIKTAAGPTSVRIEYDSGRFRLQSENRPRFGVPQRCCVVGLIQAYIDSSGPGDVWVDHSGRTVSSITVTTPLRKKPASLQHLARVAYHRNPKAHEETFSTLPSLVKSYISSYAHTC